MPYFDVEGFGRESARKRNRRYWGKNQDDAINCASEDGTLVERITLVPPAPATEKQLQYARDLRLEFPCDITCQEMSDLLSRHLEGDEPAPQWLIEHARQLGVHGSVRRSDGSTHLDDVTEFIGKRKLYDAVTAFLPGEELAIWFAYHVARDLMKCAWDDPGRSGLPLERMRAIGLRLVSDAKVMESVRQYSGSALLKFSDGWGGTGSRRTVAYRAAAVIIREWCG